MTSKSYLLMVDETFMHILRHTCPAMQFLEVQGMDLQGADDCKLLVTPVHKQPAVSEEEIAAHVDAQSKVVPLEQT